MLGLLALSEIEVLGLTVVQTLDYITAVMSLSKV
jgi:hypothetical protein